MQRWIQNRSWSFELSLTLGAIFVFGTTDYLLQGQNAIMVSAVLALSLFFSRRVPLLAALIALIGYFGAYWYSTGPLFGELAPVIAMMIAAGITTNKWVRRIEPLLIGAGLMFHSLSMIRNSFVKLALPGVTDAMATVVAYCAVADFVLVLVGSGYLLGRYILFRQSHIGSSSDVAYLRDSTGENQLKVAELDNRLSVAQDVSELVIQNVSAVISRAEGGIYAAKANPESAVRSLERVLENAQLANQEVRRLIDLLRVDRDVSAAPPGLSDVDALAVQYRELGFSVRINTEGKGVELTTGAQLAIYRIIFETLRWFAETAPKGTEFSVDYIWSENGLQVLLKDNATATANRANLKSGDADVGYGVADDVAALVEPIENQLISVVRQRANIYGGSADLLRVPGVGSTLSAYFPELRLIANESGQ